MPNLVWPARTIAELTLIGTAFGQQFVNVHHFHAGTASESGMVSDGDAITWGNSLLADWIAACKTSWLGCHSLDYVLNMVKCQVIERPGNFRHKLTATENPLTSANTGTGSSSASVTSAAANLKWRTQVAGKSHRGRTYIGPLTASWIVSGQLASTGQTACNAYGTAMIAKYAIGGSYYNTAALTIYSRAYNQGEYGWVQGHGADRAMYFPPDYAGQATNVLTSVLDLIVRSQRRRQIGVGS